MSITLFDRIRQLLVEAHPQKLTAREIAQALQVKNGDVLSRVTIMMGRRQIGRCEDPALGTKYYLYYLDDEQRARFAAELQIVLAGKRRPHPPRFALPSSAPAAPPRTAPPVAKPVAKLVRPMTLTARAKPEGVLGLFGLDAQHCQQRLKFLYHLRDKTVFSEWQLLQEIIVDYEFVLRKLLR